MSQITTNIPRWYSSRSAIFAGIYALGFLAGWAVSVAVHGRYVAAFADIGSHWGNRGVAIAAAVALAVAVAALVLRVCGASYLGSQTVWDPNAHDEELVQAGPFRVVRHPLYLGNILLALGLGAAAPIAGWAIIVLGSIFFVEALVKYEERALEMRHGAAYQAYRATVPKLLPGFSRAPASPAVRPNLAQGLRAESFTAFLLAGVVAIFVIPRYGIAAFVVCYLVGVFVQRRIERAD